MPDLRDRRKHEAALIAAMAPIFERYRNMAQRSKDQLPWGSFSAELADAIQEALVPVYTAAAEGAYREYLGLWQPGLGQKAEFGNQDINLEADRWVSNYSQVLATEIVAQTQQRLQQARQLQEDEEAWLALLLLVLGDQRLLDIGVTEVTRTITAGESGAIRIFLADSGQVMVPIWHTEQDAHVCPVCRPLHGKPPEVWRRVAPSGPGAHPRCRCWLDYRLAGT